MFSGEAGYLQRYFADALPTDTASAELATAMQAVTDAALRLPDDDERLASLSAAYRQLEQQQSGRLTAEDLPLAATAFGPLEWALGRNSDPDSFITQFVEYELGGITARLRG